MALILPVLCFLYQYFKERVVHMIGVTVRPNIVLMILANQCNFKQPKPDQLPKAITTNLHCHID